MLPPDYRSPVKVNVMEPIGVWLTGNSEAFERGNRSDMFVIGRLGSQATFTQARAEMDGIAARLARTYPGSNDQFGVALKPIRELFVSGIRPAILILFGAVMFVLLIACANVANLFLMRGAARTKEIALRGRVTMGDAVDAERGIAAAKAAFPAWSQASLDERKAWLQELANAMTERLDDLRAMCVTEFGGLAAFSDYAMTQARDFFVLAQDTLKPENFEQRVNKAAVKHVPLGVAGLLTPWNGNPWFVCGKAASALAAGCTVVIKPSQLSALEAHILMEAFHKAALPAGVINVINGRGDPVGNAITRSPDVQKISFTGSTAVGKMINRDATETMKRVTLELGGKSPTLILPDADVDGAVKFALTAGLINTGSACIAGTRILVPEGRLKEFKVAFTRAMETLKPGDPADAETTVQPMITASHWKQVQDYIKKGLEEGAELLTGGLGKPEGFEAGNFVKPTLFAQVRNEMTIAQQEIFGPVLVMITYGNEDEAVAIANDVEYGLHAYVYGIDRERTLAVANRLQAGRVMINEVVDDPKAPFGGFKLSGFGREFGVAGMLAFTETRAVFG